MKKVTIILSIILMMTLALSTSVFAVTEWDDLTLEEQKDMFKVDQSFTPFEASLTNPLASASVNPIRVNDPYASAGQPVMVEYTLSNVGSEFPFNQIALPPDSYALVMAVDKEVGFRTTNGQSINVFDKMNGVQKFMFITGLGFEVGVNNVLDTAQGQQCSFVDVFDNLPRSVQEDVEDKNDGQRPDAVYMWDCLKITSEELFEERLEEQCDDEGYSSKCIADVNKRNANAILPSTVVALSSDVPRGVCEAVGGKTAVSYLSKNVIKCGIGENGLQPGQSVTFRFVVIVPADTPVVSDEQLATSGEILEDSFTFQASCLKSQFPKACHTVYAGVYPMATDNVLKVWVDGIQDLFTIGGCSLNKLWFGSGTDFEACIEAKATSIDVVGEPIYEGQGVFFVLAPQLDSTITLILLGFFLIGGATSYSLTRRRRR